MLVAACVGPPCEVSRIQAPSPEPTPGPYANSDEMDLAEIRFVCSDKALRPIWNDLLKEPLLTEQLLQSKLQSEYDCTKILRVSEIDLNDDSKPELVVSFQYIGVCSPTANCPVAVFGIFDDERSKMSTSAGVYDFSLRRLLFDLGSINVEAQDAKSHGYRNLITTNNGSSNDDSLSEYAFDGQRYDLNKCWQFDKARQERYRVDCPPDDDE
jgi:hypothetical protein